MNEEHEEPLSRSDRDELRDLEAMRTRMRPVLTVMLLCAAAGLAGIACMIWFTDRLP
jgi:formate hydrogenlyase subunit 3/multisubunit Na+/H+ antiporter MnhD subunit